MVQLVVHHKWFVRAGLATFWAAEVIAYGFDRGFLTWLMREYPWLGLGIFFFTFKYLLEPFYAPFCKLKTHGGETVMDKSTKILLAVIAILSALIIGFLVFEDTRLWLINSANNSVAKPLMSAWLGFCNWLDGFRGIYILGSGILGGLIFAVVVKVAYPRAKKKFKGVPTPKPYMGAPEYVPPSVIAPQQTAIKKANPPTTETTLKEETEEV